MKSDVRDSDDDISVDEFANLIDGDNEVDNSKKQKDLLEKSKELSVGLTITARIGSICFLTILTS